jgi:hypothetical protein
MTAIEFFTDPDMWPLRLTDGRTGARIRRLTSSGYEYGRVTSDDSRLASLAFEGWEPNHLAFVA